MTPRFPFRLENERWFALILVLVLVLFSLFQLICLIASYLQTDPYGLQEHDPVALFLFLGSLFFYGFLLRTLLKELRRPLPLATLAGLPLGIFLGCASSLPYAFWLKLAAGLFGPLLALASSHLSPVARAYQWLDFWLSILAVLFSFVFYALVAFLLTRRTGTRWLGMWAAMLAACITLLAAASTYTVIELILVFPGSPRRHFPSSSLSRSHHCSRCLWDRHRVSMQFSPGSLARALPLDAETVRNGTKQARDPLHFQQLLVPDALP